MTAIDTYKTLNTIKIDGLNYFFYDLNKLEDRFDIKLRDVPLSLKILLENLLRNEDGDIITK